MNSDELYRDAEKALTEQTIVGEAKDDDWYSDQIDAADEPMGACKWAVEWAFKRAGETENTFYKMWIPERLANWIEEYVYELTNDD